MFLRRLFCTWIIINFLVSSIIAPPRGYAQSDLNLPEPGTMVSLSAAYTPVLIKGLKINLKNPLSLDFIVATGNSSLTAQDPQLKKESEKLIKYFFAALTLPEKDVWVNLSPYEKDRIVPKETGETEMGRDMLAQDYLLKQITASLIYPEKGLGKEFWNKVYSQASQRFGSTQIPVNTFNKVWIVADKASVYEAKDTVLVVDSHLKVMLEEDYLSMSKHANVREGLKPSPTGVNQLGSKIVREIVLPALEHEVNEGKNFANLRQIFHSLILAKWYKESLKNALLNQVYSDKNKVGGLSYKNLSSPNASRPQTGHSQMFVGGPSYIYQQYLKAYKKGVFNYIKEDKRPYSFGSNPADQQPIARKYFSGGITSAMTVVKANSNQAQKVLEQEYGALFDLAITVQMASPAMKAIKKAKMILDGQSVKVTSMADTVVDALQEDFMQEEIYDADSVVALSLKYAGMKMMRLPRTFQSLTQKDSRLIHLLMKDLISFVNRNNNIRVGYRDYKDVLFIFWQNNLTDKRVKKALLVWQRKLKERRAIALKEPGEKFDAAMTVKGRLNGKEATVRYINIILGDIKKDIPFSKRPQTPLSKQDGKPLVGFRMIKLDELKKRMEKNERFLNLGNDALAELKSFVDKEFRALSFQQYREKLSQKLYPILVWHSNDDEVDQKVILAIRKWVLFKEAEIKYPEFAQANQARINLAMQAKVDKFDGSQQGSISKGGIDLNSSKINMKKSGPGMEIYFNPAMMGQFKQGNFEGIVPVITSITAINDISPLLGLQEPPKSVGVAV